MISGETKILGLIGNPVKHSISPIIQNAALKEKNLDYTYVAFKVDGNSLTTAVEGIKSLGIEGINVTIPHKSTIIENLDKIDETAEKIGAVNTVKRKENRLIGFNTDGIGVLKSLENKIGKIKNKDILLLGAGGAARAIAFTLLEADANLTISNRTVPKAEELVREIKEKTGIKIEQIPQTEESLSKIISNSEVIINSTSVGMHPNEDETILKAETLHENLIVMDIVYNPLQTRLLNEAEKAGAETISGLGMLVYQGAASFELWTGEEAPIETMKKVGKDALEGR